MDKAKRNSIIIIVILAVAFGLFMINRFTVEKGIALADDIDLGGKDFYHVKEGYYCGEGGCTEEHYIGYIYYSDKLTKEQALEKADFRDYFGNTYTDGDGKTYKEYSNGGESAIIEKIVDYKDGHLLKYHIIGCG